jgi:hypothetical protein
MWFKTKLWFQFGRRFGSFRLCCRVARSFTGARFFSGSLGLYILYVGSCRIQYIILLVPGTPHALPGYHADWTPLPTTRLPRILRLRALLESHIPIPSRESRVDPLRYHPRYPRCSRPLADYSRARTGSQSREISQQFQASPAPIHVPPRGLPCSPLWPRSRPQSSPRIFPNASDTPHCCLL